MMIFVAHPHRSGAHIFFDRREIQSARLPAHAVTLARSPGICWLSDCITGPRRWRRSRHFPVGPPCAGEANELARQLVAAGLPDRPMVRGEMRELDARHLDQAQLAGREHPAVRPAMIPLSPSSKIGLVKPNSRMLPAICATWSSECVRALRA